VKTREPKRSAGPLSTIAQWSVWEALEGDPYLLAARLRKGGATPEEMALAADLIEKKVKIRRPKMGKPGKITKEQIAGTVLYISASRPHWPEKAIIYDVAKAFGVSERFVRYVVASWRRRPVEIPYETDLIKRILARN
jgi:hypothetical protein